MKEFNFWCKENTDFGKCDNKKCGFFECGCYGSVSYTHLTLPTTPYV